MALLPAMTALASTASRAAAFLQEHSTAAKVGIAAVGGLAAAVIATNAALKVYAATQALIKGATIAWQWACNGRSTSP